MLSTYLVATLPSLHSMLHLPINFSDAIPPIPGQKPLPMLSFLLPALPLFSLNSFILPIHLFPFHSLVQYYFLPILNAHHLFLNIPSPPTTNSFLSTNVLDTFNVSHSTAPQLLRALHQHPQAKLMKCLKQWVRYHKQDSYASFRIPPLEQHSRLLSLSLSLTWLTHNFQWVLRH